MMILLYTHALQARHIHAPAAGACSECFLYFFGVVKVIIVKRVKSRSSKRRIINTRQAHRVMPVTSPRGPPRELPMSYLRDFEHGHAREPVHCVSGPRGENAVDARAARLCVASNASSSHRPEGRARQHFVLRAGNRPGQTPSGVLEAGKYHMARQVWRADCRERAVRGRYGRSSSCRVGARALYSSCRVHQQQRFSAQARGSCSGCIPRAGRHQNRKNIFRSQFLLSTRLGRHTTKQTQGTGDRCRVPVHDSRRHAPHPAQAR